MATVLDLATDSLIEIGVLAAGETPTAEDGAFALRALNRSVDQWAAERLYSYTTTRTTWTITASDGSYTVGSGADVNIARPVFVDHVNVIDTSTDPDMEIPLSRLTEDAYAAITLKAQTSVYPQSWYYNPTYANATLILWPTPTSSTLQGAIYVPTAVSEFSALSDTVSLPPGYRRMIVKALALELAPSYGRQVDKLLFEQAQEAKAAVKRANVRMSDLSFESAALIGGRRGVFNIRTGQ